MHVEHKHTQRGPCGCEHGAWGFWGFRRVLAVCTICFKARSLHREAAKQKLVCYSKYGERSINKHHCRCLHPRESLLCPVATLMSADPRPISVWKLHMSRLQKYTFISESTFIRPYRGISFARLSSSSAAAGNENSTKSPVSKKRSKHQLFSGVFFYYK